MAVIGIRRPGCNKSVGLHLGTRAAKLKAQAIAARASMTWALW